jgi:MtN3 and saliva related transmembrane protein
MYAFTVTGFALWLTFGSMLRQWPIVVSNFVCLVLSAFILVMKLLPQPKKDAVADSIDPNSRN